MFFARRCPRSTNKLRLCSTLYSPENILSEENKNKTIAKLKNTPQIRLQAHTPAKRAAVLIPLCVLNHKVSLLYTLRAPNLKSHRGQVSFPGGMQDEKDKDLVETALRETREELGISEKLVEIWGTGNLIITGRDMCVLPVVGQIKQQLDLEKLNTNHHEVQEVYMVSLEDLCDPEKIGHTQFRGGYSAPVFWGGPRRIWGLTGIITKMFLSCLLSTKAYSHKINYVPNVKSI